MLFYNARARAHAHLCAAVCCATTKEKKERKKRNARVPLWPLSFSFLFPCFALRKETRWTFFEFQKLTEREQGQEADEEGAHLVLFCLFKKIEGGGGGDPHRDEAVSVVFFLFCLFRGSSFEEKCAS